jgi:HNH endonuclease
VFFRDFQRGYYRYLPVSFQFCRGCRALFAARLDDQDYCSRECGPMPPKYAVRLREMAVKASPGFRRADVFERDGWVCHICGDPVDRESADPLNRASLDHVVPIARGGLHTLEYVKCAHLRCNIRKSDDEWVGKEAVGLRPALRAEAGRSPEPLRVPLGREVAEVYEVQPGVEALERDSLGT